MTRWPESIFDSAESIFWFYRINILILQKQYYDSVESSCWICRINMLILESILCFCGINILIPAWPTYSDSDPDMDWLWFWHSDYDSRINPVETGIDPSIWYIDSRIIILILDSLFWLWRIIIPILESESNSIRIIIFDSGEFLWTIILIL